MEEIISKVTGETPDDSKREESISQNQVKEEVIYDEDKKINVPAVEISSDSKKGMIPIKYNGQNWQVCSEDDKEWYDYDKKQWANIMLSDGKYKVGEVQVGQVIGDDELGSMFVWIPRFAYKIKKYRTTINGSDGETQNITEVEFLKADTNVGTSGATYSEDYDADSVNEGEETPMIVHPAFKFGDKNLKGIWVAKFEASMQEENTNVTSNNNQTDKTIKILPNAESWRYINIANAFLNCFNMKNNKIYQISESLDTHLIKNNEWGATAYLSASQYGTIPAINNSIETTTDGITKYHSYCAKKDYKSNTNLSTTGNVYGIYDMNGGSWEYVAAYWNNTSDTILKYGTSQIFAEDNNVKQEYKKYFEQYSIEGDDGASGIELKNDEGNILIVQAAYNRLNLQKNVKGNALYEVTKEVSGYGINSNGKFNWFRSTAKNEDGTIKQVTEGMVSALYGRDHSLMGNINSPFLLRGGYWNNGSSSGIFAFYGCDGAISSGRGFRPVIV